MDTPVLSICIPTFNRASYLEDCLKSLEESWIPGVEIVVSDNASDDNTEEVLKYYSNKLPMRCQRQPKNVGFDRNCAAVVELARGAYCWILGSDDCIASGALSKVMVQLLHYNPDIFHLGYIQADLAMQPMSSVLPPSSSIPPSSSPEEIAKYIASLKNISLAFAFISCFIFRRERWIAQLDRLPGWLDSHYVHTYMLHAMLAAKASVLPSNDCLVIARGGNPNEWNSKPGKLMSLDAMTVMRIYREVYGEAIYLKALGDVYRRSYPLKFLVYVAAYDGLSYLRPCQSSLEELGYPSMLIRSLIFIEWLGVMPAVTSLIVLRRRILNFFK